MLRRLERDCTPVDDAAWAGALARACAELGLRHPVALLAGEAITVPMTWGTWRPRVLLPAGCTSWSPERRRVVLLHELAHVQRRDCLTQFLAQVVRAVYWFNPLAWLAVWRMQVERERACDDVVLRLGTQPSNYAGHLVSLAAGLRAGALPLGATAMARSAKVVRRVREILEERRSRWPVTRRHVVAAAALLACVTVPLACMRSGGTGGAGAGVGTGTAVAGGERAEPQPPAWTAEQAHAADDLRLLAAAMVYYSAEYRGRYPGHPSLLYPGYVALGAKEAFGRTLTPAEEVRAFLSPHDEARVEVPEKPARDWLLKYEQRRNEYVYLGADARQLMGHPHHSTILLMHTDLNAPFRDAAGRETAVGVFFDGHAEVLPLAEVRRLSEQTKVAVEKVKPFWAELERRDKERAATRRSHQQ